MEIDLVFKIAAFGIIISVMNQLLKNAGREDIATLATLAGLVIVPVVSLITPKLKKEQTKEIFECYEK